MRSAEADTLRAPPPPFAPVPTFAAAAPVPIFTRLWMPALALALCIGLQRHAAGLAWWPSTPAHALAAEQALSTLTWLAALWLLVRAADALVWERLLPRLAAVRFPRLLRQTLALMITIVGLATMLTMVWGFALGPMIAATGAIGIIAGLALRNLLADFFAGIALNMEHPFRLDDFVLLHIRGKREPVAGFVREINWRSTTVLTPEDNLVSVPNNVVALSTVENLSFPSPVYELELEVRLCWHLSADVAERLLGAATVDAWVRGATHGDRPPKVRICRLDAASVTWRIVYLIDPRRSPKGPARHLLLASVQRHLRLAGLRPTVGEAIAPEAPQRAWSAWIAEDRARMLEQAPLLEMLSADERATLAAGMLPRACRTGEAVLRAGEAGDSMFMLVAGVLEVRLPELTQRVAVLSPGDCFGEMSLVSGEPRSADVIALSPVLLLEITRDQIGPLLAAREPLAAALAGAIDRHQQRYEASRSAAAATPSAAPAPGRAEAVLKAMRGWFSN